jgi:2Fe-2S ferredoxin
MAQIVVTDRDGTDHLVQGTNGISLMEIFKEAGIEGIIAMCGGCCACATCHVYVDSRDIGRLPALEDEEEEMLSSADHRQENSRLSCQIEFSPDLDGLRVSVAPA